MPMTDEWSGFADLLANLIEKYASELDMEDMPDPLAVLDTGSTVEKTEKDLDSIQIRVAGKTAA